MANVKPVQRRNKAAVQAQPKLSPAWSGFIASVVAAVLLGVWRLSSGTAGMAGPSDLATKHTLYLDSPWWKSLGNIYGPFYALLHGTFAISHSLFFLRLASVAFGLLSVALVYFLIEHWHGYRIALLSAAAYISSFGYLVVTHQATPISSQLPLAVGLLAAVIALNAWDNVWPVAAMALALVYALYVPGGIWLGIAALVLSFPYLKDSVKDIEKKWRLAIGGGFILLLLPLAYRLGMHYSLDQTLNWLGYGLHGRLAALTTLGTNILKVPGDLFAYSLNLPRSMRLGHLPLLPVAESIIILVGLYCYVTRIKSYNWRAVIVLMAVSWLIVSFGVLSVFCILPLVMLALGSGLTYLLKQWYTVFPRNPIARQTGLIVMSLIVLFSCFFAARSYFVAWSNDPAQSASFSHRL